MKYKSICIAGIDGTGKSSAVENLRKRIGENKAVVQYMGAKQWESRLGVKYFIEDSFKGPFRPIMWVVSYIYEMYHRYYKYKGTDKIVIFDRYAYEHTIIRDDVGGGMKGKLFSFIYKCAFLWLFPRPVKTFYLVCPLELSLSRKSDIITKEEIANLNRNKKILDNFYKDRRGVVVIDTAKENKEEVVSHIYNEIQFML